MRQLGQLATDADLLPNPAVYGSSAGNTSTWDADVMHGCYCDWMVGRVVTLSMIWSMAGLIANLEEYALGAFQDSEGQTQRLPRNLAAC